MLIEEGLMIVLRRQTNFKRDYKAAAAIESLATSVLSISTHQTRLTIRLRSLKATFPHSFNIFIGFGCGLKLFFHYVPRSLDHFALENTLFLYTLGA
jgi:hypothetical protein